MEHTQVKALILFFIQSHNTRQRVVVLNGSRWKKVGTWGDWPWMKAYFSQSAPLGVKGFQKAKRSHRGVVKGALKSMPTGRLLTKGKTPVTRLESISFRCHGGSLQGSIGPLG